jgi:hypothetical protein
MPVQETVHGQFSADNEPGKGHSSLGSLAIVRVMATVFRVHSKLFVALR